MSAFAKLRTLCGVWHRSEMMVHALGIVLAAGAALAVDPMSLRADQKTEVDACWAGPYVFSFKQGSAYLSAQQRKLLADVVAEARDCGDELLIESYPSDDGAADLQKSRAYAVFDYLTRKRITAKKVAVSIRAEGWPALSEDGQQRNVQVFLAIWR